MFGIGEFKECARTFFLFLFTLMLEEKNDGMYVKI